MRFNYKPLNTSWSLLLVIIPLLINPIQVSASVTNGIENIDIVETSNAIKAEINFLSPLNSYNDIELKLTEDKNVTLLTLENAIARLGIIAILDKKDNTILVLEVPKPLVTEETELLLRFMEGDWHEIYNYFSFPEEIDKISSEEVATMTSEIEGHNSCSGCQCTDFVHCMTNITFKKCWGKEYGDAGEWYNYAKKCDFDRSSSTPKDKSILVMKGGSHGHVIYVKDEKKKNTNEYELKIEHKNWDNCKVSSETIKYNKKTHKIFLRGKWIDNMPVDGFIYKWTKQ